MPIPVLICDDSSFARNQLARALPQDWDIQVSFACNGSDALAAIQAGKGDILFLDLNMPGMDGYEVLEIIRAQDLPTMVIVVSGDIQPEARQRVMRLGALDFIKKPINEALVNEILKRYGIHVASRPNEKKAAVAVDLRDGYREVANVAMGRAADLLARLLGVFVEMPIPNVNTIEAGELRMAIHQIGSGAQASAVCQGFVGAGIAGEALLMFDDSSLSDVAALLEYQGDVDEAVRYELITDVASVITGACLKGIADQLDISFSQSYPIVLGRDLDIEELIKRNSERWKSMLAVEMACKVEDRNIRCNLLLLFTEDSLPALNERVSFLAA